MVSIYISVGHVWHKQSVICKGHRMAYSMLHGLKRLSCFLTLCSIKNSYGLRRRSDIQGFLLLFLFPIVFLYYCSVLFSNTWHHTLGLEFPKRILLKGSIVSINPSIHHFTCALCILCEQVIIYLLHACNNHLRSPIYLFIYRTIFLSSIYLSEKDNCVLFYYDYYD